MSIKRNKRFDAGLQRKRAKMILSNMWRRRCFLYEIHCFGFVFKNIGAQLKFNCVNAVLYALIYNPA